MKNVGYKVEAMIGVVILVVLVVSIAPTLFQNVGTTGTGIGNTTYSGAPAWLSSVLIVLISAVIVMVIWRGASVH